MLVLSCIVFVISYVTATQSALHVNSHPVGPGSFIQTRRTPKVVFIELSDSNDVSSAENLQRNSYDKDDIQRLIDQIENRVKSLAYVRNKNKKQPLQKKNVEYDNTFDDDIVDLIKKAMNKQHKVTGLLNSSKSQRTNNKERHNYNQKLNLEGIAAYLKTVFQKESSLNSKQNYLFARPGKRIKSAEPSLFTSDGMLYITKPKDNREPNLSALLKKVLDSQRGSGTGRSGTNPLFNRDEIHKLEKIKNDIDKENDRASFEFRNDAVQSLEEAVIRDEMADLQKAREQIIPSFKYNTVVDRTNGRKESKFDTVTGVSRSGTDSARYSKALRDLELLAHGGKESTNFLSEIDMLRSAKDYETAELRKGLEEEVASLQKPKKYVPLRVGNYRDGRRDKERVFDFDSLVY